MRRTIVIALFIGVIVLVASHRLEVPGLGIVGGGTESVVDDSNADDPIVVDGLLVAPDGESLGICLDATGSTPSPFAPAVRHALVEGVDTYVPPAPAERALKKGVAALPGLELTLRLVATRPIAYGEPLVRVVVPAVPGLPARPDMTADGALEPGGAYPRWKELVEEWTVAHAAAETEASEGAQALADLDLSAPGRSGVRDCLSALDSVEPVHADLHVVVASDLRDNSSTGGSVSFDSAPTTLIQPCPHGDARACAAVTKTFKTWLTEHGSGPIDDVRPEVAAEALVHLITSNS